MRQVEPKSRLQMSVTSGAGAQLRPCHHLQTAYQGSKALPSPLQQPFSVHDRSRWCMHCSGPLPGPGNSLYGTPYPFSPFPPLLCNNVAAAAGAGTAAGHCLVQTTTRTAVPTLFHPSHPCCVGCGCSRWCGRCWSTTSMKRRTSSTMPCQHASCSGDTNR